MGDINAVKLPDIRERPPIHEAGYDERVRRLKLAQSEFKEWLKATAAVAALLTLYFVAAVLLL